MSIKDFIIFLKKELEKANTQLRAAQETHNKAYYNGFIDALLGVLEDLKTLKEV